MNVIIPIHVMMTILTKPTKGEEWMRNAAREYAHREIKKHFPEKGEWQTNKVLTPKPDDVN